MGPLVIIILGLLLSGCFNLTTTITPENPYQLSGDYSEGQDCTPIVLGWTWGSSNVWTAMHDAVPVITDVKSIRLHQYYFFLAGASCVEVLGKGTPPAAINSPPKSLTPDEYYKRLGEEAQ